VYLRGNTRSRETRGKQKEINKEIRRKQEGDRRRALIWYFYTFYTHRGAISMANIPGTEAVADVIIPGFNSADTGLPTPVHDAITGLGGDDFINGWGGNDDIFGGAGDDKLLGDTGPDTLNGDAGSDLLLGGTGVDILNGGDGSDTLLGENGNDRLDGGVGRDYLVGGDGADRLVGGGDNDTFIYNVGAESNAANTDTITDFQGGGLGNVLGDQIDLSNIDVDTSTPDDETFNWHTGAWIGTGDLGELAMSGDRLLGDTDGVAGAELEIILTGVSTLSVGAFDGTDVLV
jgi:Ca2+-binding RTX toxin-like protein